MSLAGAPGLGAEPGALGGAMEVAAGAGDRPCKQYRIVPNRIKESLSIPLFFYYYLFSTSRLRIFFFVVRFFLYSYKTSETILSSDIVYWIMLLFMIADVCFTTYQSCLQRLIRSF
jgi:hypothetical protein